jgi:hypothetical protein
MASKPGQPSSPGMSLAGDPLIGQVVPGMKAARVRSAAFAWNVGRRVAILLSCVEVACGGDRERAGQQKL